MKSKFAVLFMILLSMSLLTSCAATRMAGRIGQATGDVMVKSADEEEAKGAKKKNEQQSSSKSGNSKNQQEKTTSKEAVSSETKIITIKKNYTTVNVRPEPSTKKAPVAKLSGGDKVEKIAESSGWLKIRFNIDGSEGEGWISKDLVEN